MVQDYNATLNLPKTDFQMRAALPQREPKMMENWDKLYYEMIENNEGKPRYILHDGPPYANGDIHLGTSLNKVLKDIVVRHKNMAGFQAPYVPGWDTHGLPIELKAMKKVGTNVSPVELRRNCRDFALGYVDTQIKQFQRLGVLADYKDPYLTLKPEFEAVQIQIFGTMAKKNFIYKGLKPVYWCPECVTALAEAEIEYADDHCHSIYVKFKVCDDKGILTKLGADENTYFVIWTTTTWTLPGNMAICLGADFEYAVVKANNEYLVIAKELVENTMKAASISEYEIVGTCIGKDLEYITYKHPFLERVSPIILGEHVTLESGTGCVHTAPGHGVEDFEVVKNHYPEINIVVPVDNVGKLTADAGRFEGLTTNDANKKIAQYLEENGNLLAIKKIVHQYPHCWRCKTPILFRATEQWFCSINGFKDDAMKAIKEVKWIPGWGEDRIISMVRDRSDWCISRQRTWGVPIPIFYCKSCNKPIIEEETINAVSELFKREGSDAWYLKSADEILPKDFKCDCGCAEFTKETDIMDVWFDSGVTHAAVIAQRENLAWPADLYLEGNDQFRGWFQSSLLTSVASNGKAPYKAVCTHGMVVDDGGVKQSKSLGNGMAPEEIINEYGADILRLWVASSDYHTDVRISKEILKQLSEVYRKIRNTARFILGNIEGQYDPNKNAVSYNDLPELDKWALCKMDELCVKVYEAYTNLEFHVIYHSIHNFCTIDMSNFYLDIIKDRLYVEKTDSLPRRAAQTVMHEILINLTLMIAPIIPFTAGEIWDFIPLTDKYNKKSVMFNEVKREKTFIEDKAFEEKWDKIHELRDEVNKALETARNNKLVGKSLEAKIILSCDGEKYDFIESILSQLCTIFIVSDVQLERKDSDSIEVQKADGQKCERCWTYSKTVGTNTEHSTLCARCSGIVIGE